MTDKNTLLSFPLSLVLLFSLVSCSHEEKAPVQEHAYSESTQREFEAIEKSDSTKSSRVPPAHDLHHLPGAQVQRKTPELKTPAPVQPPVEQPKLTTESALSSRNQERLQEINQNLAFFCMKHRNDRAFSSEEQCLKFTKNVLKTCEKKHKLINTVMVNCIKDHLKKRK